MRPKLPPDHVRLQWLCTCGVQMYADYPDSDHMADFQDSLGYTRARYSSFAHMLGFEGRSRLLRAASSLLFGLVTALPVLFGLFAALFFHHHIGSKTDALHQSHLHSGDRLDSALTVFHCALHRINRNQSLSAQDSHTYIQHGIASTNSSNTFRARARLSACSNLSRRLCATT
jgi:hypothetical protein